MSANATRTLKHHTPEAVAEKGVERAALKVVPMAVAAKVEVMVEVMVAAVRVEGRVVGETEGVEMAVARVARAARAEAQTVQRRPACMPPRILVRVRLLLRSVVSSA